MKENPCYYFFTNLANPLKINIILSLEKREKNVTELSKELKIEQSKTSHALSSLKCCNIVNVKQKGKQRIYYLNRNTIIPLLKLVKKHSSAHCKPNLCLKIKN